MKKILLTLGLTFSAGFTMANTMTAKEAEAVCQQYQTYHTFSCSQLGQLPQSNCESTLAVADQYDEVASALNSSISTSELNQNTRSELVSVQLKFRQKAAGVRIGLIYGNEDLCQKIR